MKYFTTLVLALFVGHSFGATETQSIVSTNQTPSLSTNLLKAVKASPTPPPKWDGTFTLGLTATAGNVDSVLAAAKVAAQKKTAKDSWNLGADGAYGEVSSVKSAESAHGFGQYNHIFVDDTWYGYGRSEAWHDAIANVAYRFSSGGGAGYYFIKNKQTTLSSEAGPAIRVEQLDDEYHNYPTARLAQNFERKIDDHARVWENVEILPPINVPEAFLINAEVGVETPLTHELSWQTYLQDNFANQPAPGFKDNDLKVVSGVVFKF